MIAVDAIDIIAKEHTRQTSGAVSDVDIAKMGFDAGAQYVCVVEITKFGGKTYVSTGIVHVERKLSVNSEINELLIGGDAIELIQRQVNGMLGIGKHQTVVTPASAPKPTPSTQKSTTKSSPTVQKAVPQPTNLEEIKRQLDSQNMPCGIGMGESADERKARDASHDEARRALIASTDVAIMRLGESYAQNVSGEAKAIWEEATRQIVSHHIRGTDIFMTVVTYHSELKRYRIYTLIILNPSLFKAAILKAMSNDEELELRIKKDDMIAKLDANIAEYDAKYKR
jgi:hypothetical protein